MQRTDLRKMCELRALMCTRGELCQASGSARWTQGKTSVLAAVYGPALTSKKEADEQCILDVSFHLTRIDIGDREACFKQLLHDALHSMLLLKSFPRCYVRLDVQVLYDDGSLLSCAFNAACNALMDAGFPMRYQWSSTTVAVLPDDVLLIDPTKSEEQDAKAVLSAMFPAYQQSEDGGSDMKICIIEAPSCCWLCGTMSSEKYFCYLEVCRRGCEKVTQFNCEAAEKHLKHLHD